MLMIVEKKDRSMIGSMIVVIGALLLAGLDQWAKYLAVSYLSAFTPQVVIDHFFQLILVKNRGAAFGLMSGMEDPARSTIFGIISVFAFVVVIYVYRSRPPGSWMVPISVCLILGGATGNIIDRVRLGHVVDFLDFFVSGYHWPTFNVADSCITVGVTVLMIQMFLEEWRRHES